MKLHWAAADCWRIQQGGAL